MSEDPNPLSSGKLGPVHVAGYEVLETLGIGSLGAVYKALHPQLGRVVALKVLDPHLAADKDQVKRFLREARSASKLKHPAIVGLHDVGTCKITGLNYIALEFVDGRSLEDELRAVGRFDEQRALELCHSLAGALERAQAEDIVHRNIKPDYILLTASGRPKLSGLGLAKRRDSNSLTHAGTLLGSAHYVSPEQAQSVEDLDVRADIYSLGVTLYRMVTGRVPFEGRSFFEVAEQHITKRVPDPRERVPALSENVTTLVAGMCARSRDDRYGTARALVRDLARVLTGATARGPSGPPTSGTNRRVVLPDEKAPTLPFEVLVQEAGAVPVTHRLDKDRVTVGRSGGCDVQIDNSAISRMHAELKRDGLTLSLSPLSATNITAINEEPVREPTLLDMEDTIVLSEAVMLMLRWVVPEKPEPEPEPEALAPGMKTHVLEREAVFEDLDPPADPLPTPTVHLRDGVLVERSRAAPPPEVPARGFNDETQRMHEDTGRQPPGFVVHVRDGSRVRERVQGGFQLGRSALCNARLPDPAPRKAALIVRCEDCYQLWNMCDDPATVTLNGEPVPDSAVLADGDVIDIYGVEVSFEQKPSS